MIHFRDIPNFTAQKPDIAEGVANEQINIWATSFAENENPDPEKKLAHTTAAIKADQVLGRFWLLQTALRWSRPTISIDTHKGSFRTDEGSQSMKGELTQLATSIASYMEEMALDIFKREKGVKYPYVRPSEYFMEKAYLGFRAGGQWQSDFHASQLLRQMREQSFLHPLAQAGHALHPYLTAMEAHSYLAANGPEQLGHPQAYELIGDAIAKEGTYKGLKHRLQVSNASDLPGDTYTHLIESFFNDQIPNQSQSRDAEGVDLSPFANLLSRLMQAGFLPKGDVAVDTLLTTKKDVLIRRTPVNDPWVSSLRGALTATMKDIEAHQWNRNHQGAIQTFEQGGSEDVTRSSLFDPALADRVDTSLPPSVVTRSAVVNKVGDWNTRHGADLAALTDDYRKNNKGARHRRPVGGLWVSRSSGRALHRLKG